MSENKTIPVYYTVKEVSEMLKVTSRTVTNWITSGKLKSVKAGKAVRISQDAIDEFLIDRAEQQ